MSEQLVIQHKNKQTQEKVRKSQRDRIISNQRQGLLNSIFDSSSTQKEPSQSQDITPHQSQQQIRLKQEIEEIENALKKESKEFSSEYLLKLIKLLLNIQGSQEQIDSKKNYAFEVAQKLELMIAPKCNKCGEETNIRYSSQSLENLTWRCYQKSCQKPKIKLYSQHPIFKDFKCSLTRLLKLFLYNFPSQHSNSIILFDFKSSTGLLTKGRKIWQEIIRCFYKNYYKNIILGESTAAVEVDEACFKRKYQRGRVLQKSQWILGMTQRDGGFQKTVLVPVLARDANTLCPLISSSHY